VISQAINQNLKITAAQLPTILLVYLTVSPAESHINSCGVQTVKQFILLKIKYILRSRFYYKSCASLNFTSLHITKLLRVHSSCHKDTHQVSLMSPISY